MKKQRTLYTFLTLTALWAFPLLATGLRKDLAPSPHNPDQPTQATPTRQGQDIAEVRKGQESTPRIVPKVAPAAPERKLSRKEKKIARQFSKAYELLLHADKAREARTWSSALRFYEDSLGLHSKLAEKYPKWQPGVVKFRLAYCDIRVQEMIKTMEAMKDSPGLRTAPSEFVGPLRPAPRAEASPVKNPPSSVPMVGPPRRQDVNNGRPASQKDPRTLRTNAPDDLSRIVAAGKQLLKAGQADDAKAVLLQALKRDPDNAEVRLLIAMAQCQQKSFNDAMHVMRSLIRERPKDAHAYLVLGTAYFGLNRLDEAEIAMQQAIHLDPTLGEAHFNLAQIYLSGTPPEKDRARRHYARALQLGIPSDKRLEKGLQGK